MSEGHRAERVAELLLRELSAMLLRELKDPRLSGVTLTSAQVTADLRHARVLFSHLEGKQRAQDAEAGFQRAGGFIRREVGHRLGLRYAPEITFEFDTGIEKAARIDALLRDIRSRE